ncbi:hypothetical protein CFB50_06995 [Burkholderia sp. AU33423]|nr:hypothetical protein CFB50_06995 [Burkholderia sp. AU33423]
MHDFHVVIIEQSCFIRIVGWVDFYHDGVRISGLANRCVLGNQERMATTTVFEEPPQLSFQRRHLVVDVAVKPESHQHFAVSARGGDRGEMKWIAKVCAFNGLDYVNRIAGKQPFQVAGVFRSRSGGPDFGIGKRGVDEGVELPAHAQMVIDGANGVVGRFLAVLFVGGMTPGRCRIAQVIDEMRHWCERWWGVCEVPAPPVEVKLVGAVASQEFPSPCRCVGHVVGRIIALVAPVSATDECG